MSRCVGIYPRRLSISSTSTQADGFSGPIGMSANGRYVVFDSTASNLVPGDTNGGVDTFVRDTVMNTTTRISVGMMGVEADGGSSPFSGDISADGRYVAFSSQSTNLVLGDTNGVTDVFVRDVVMNTTIRVSVGPMGAQSGGHSGGRIALSGDGRYVAFGSAAENLVIGDTNRTGDVFVRDTVMNTTVRVSVGPMGVQANSGSLEPTISADGRYVAFVSAASNLVPGGVNVSNVFVRDRATNTTTLVSLGNTGGQIFDGSVFGAEISANGSCVVFGSDAVNLVPGDTNNASDVFLRDLVTNTTTRVSIGLMSTQGNRGSGSPSVSADCRYVAFISDASNLVPGDTNDVADVFVRDMVMGTTMRVSVGPMGAQSTGRVSFGTLSGDGRYVAFRSSAVDLVVADTNGTDDAFFTLAH